MAVTSSTIPAPVQAYFSMKLLAFPVPNMIHSVAATQKIMEANSGRTIRFRRYNRLNPAIAPLGNQGLTPPSSTPTIVDKRNVHVKSSLIDLKAVVAIS